MIMKAFALTTIVGFASASDPMKVLDKFLAMELETKDARFRHQSRFLKDCWHAPGENEVKSLLLENQSLVAKYNIKQNTHHQLVNEFRNLTPFDQQKVIWNAAWCADDNLMQRLFHNSAQEYRERLRSSVK